MSLFAAYLSPEIAAWAAKHVRIVEDDVCPTACLELTPRGYVLTLGKLWHELAGNPAARTDLLMHELGHLLRGDCLARPDDPHAWNVACDAVINALGRFDALEAVSPGIRWAQVAQTVGGDPAVLPTARWIYDRLVQRSSGSSRKDGADGQDEDARRTDGSRSGGGDGDGRQGSDHGSAPGGLGDDVRGYSGDRDACEAAHAAAVLDAPRHAALDQWGRGTIQAAPPRPLPPRKPAHPAALALRKAMRYVRGVRGRARQRRRTWLREGRHPWMPGRARVASARVAICVDVSASMRHIVEECLGAARWLAQTADARVMVWADSAQWVHGASVPPVGYGTQPDKMFALLAQWHPDTVVVLTDGLWPPAQRPASLERTPIVWVCANRDYIPIGARDVWCDVKHEAAP